ncbi:hypothetical protein I3843_09G131500 [Carya illinoinensis]|nr:hypothetical protein I3843_09G131500 [Carya illinoinensis]
MANKRNHNFLFIYSGVLKQINFLEQSPQNLGSWLIWEL